MAAEKRFQSPVGRLSFPFIFKPRPAEKPGDKEKFSLSLIFDEEAQKTPEWKAITDEVKAVALAKFGVDHKQPDGSVKRVVPKGVRNPIRNGEDKELDGYGPGKVFVSATSERKPGVIGGDMLPITDEKGCYAGCYVRASLTVFSYERKDGKGVSLGLRNIQKVRDGEPFGGGGDPTKDFAPVADYKSSGAATDFGAASGSTDSGEVPF